MTENMIKNSLQAVRLRIKINNILRENMADNWNLRGKTQMLDDLNTPSLQCRVYDRIAVQDSKGKTHFYCLELSAGNTFDFGFCRKENVPSLLRDVMTMGSIRVLSGICDDLMVPTVPTVLWLNRLVSMILNMSSCGLKTP